MAGLDLNLDGADEVDPQFRMIKGRGGALLREKIVACVAARRVTIITEDKRVDRLGANAPIPVEVSHVGLKHTERRIQKLGAETKVRHLPAGTFTSPTAETRSSIAGSRPSSIRSSSTSASVGRRGLRDRALPGPVRYPRDRDLRRSRAARSGDQEESRLWRLSRSFSRGTPLAREWAPRGQRPQDTGLTDDTARGGLERGGDGLSPVMVGRNIMRIASGR